MKNFILFILSFFFSFASAQVSPTGETEIKTAKVYFKVNSSRVYTMDAAQLREVANATIISIEGYASIEGNSIANHDLSQARAAEVKHLFRANSADIEISYYGGTEAFGSDYKDNRVVIVTYAVFKQSTPVTGSVDTTTPVKFAFQHAEGFDCNNKIDGSVYFADTLETETADTAITTIPAPIVLETIEIETANNIALTVTPITVDTLFLPVNQAVRFQMQKNGMSRKEAIRSIEARKSQWKELKPKTAKARKSKAKKVSMKRTRGVNSSMFVRIFPFAGC